MTGALLQPAVALVLWTIAMLGWMLATRLPALAAAGIRLGALVGSKASDADRSLPAEAQWKAHNYNHLLEQPTLFYATVGVLAMSGAAATGDVMLAWAYVVLRVAHSIWQATVNRVRMRLVLFVASSLVLAALAVRAAIAVF